LLHTSRQASGWTDSIPQPTSVAIEKLRLLGPHALEVRVRDLQLLRELPAGKRRDAVPLHAGGLLDLECALAVLRRALMRVRRLARCGRLSPGRRH